MAAQHAGAISGPTACSMVPVHQPEYSLRNSNGGHPMQSHGRLELLLVLDHQFVIQYLSLLLWVPKSVVLFVAVQVQNAWIHGNLADIVNLTSQKEGEVEETRAKSQHWAHQGQVATARTGLVGH